MPIWLIILLIYCSIGFFFGLWFWGREYGESISGGTSVARAFIEWFVVTPSAISVVWLPLFVLIFYMLLSRRS